MKLSLRNTFTVLLAVTVTGSVLTALALAQASAAGAASSTATSARYNSYQLAAELRQSSDDLTRLARTYVVSGEPKWEQQYQEVLDIRNGKKPRPDGYERIYWDFRAADLPAGEGAGNAMALSDRMKLAGFTEAEFSKLQDSQKESNDLVRTETIAMNLVKGLADDGHGGFTKKVEPDRVKAQAMMHDLVYHQNKAKIMQPINAFLVMLDKRTLNAVDSAESARRLWSMVAMATMLVTGLVLGGLAWLVRGRTLGVVSQAQQVAMTIANGRLDTKIEVQGHDEAAQLLGALERMRCNLGGIIAKVRASSDSIATGSAQIATGNLDLSQRTEAQASNLQQTAAAMEQISGTVKSSADTAEQANRLASSASAAAVKGGEMVNNVVTTMQDIAASSKRIADIIGVIDGIAFQTNILALNAAVEAARAGEQGRGFAVVASEVRSLASRSAEAAKEIKSLIGASVDKVEVGTQQVNTAGASMGEIVSQVQRVSQMIGELSRAAAEQTGGIGQVGQAVAQLDEVTQQNAALVEESAAAADSLKRQALVLAELVSTFQVAGEHATGVAA